MAERKRRSVRQASFRKASVYVDPDTDDDFEIDPDADYDSVQGASKRTQPTGTRSRRIRQKTEESDVSNASPARSSSKAKAIRHRRKRRSLRHSTTGANVVNKVAARVGRPRRKTTKKPKTTAVDQKPGIAATISTDGVSPPWQTLPYEILLQIFSYTADSHTWLLRSARGICRNFAAPALAAFYQNPVLPTSSHLETLYALVSQPSDSRTIRYKAIVKKLELDIHAFVNRKDENDTFEVASLIGELPQLEGLLITSVQDKPPYRRHALPRWKYPNSLFAALDNTERQLKSWRWNWLFIRHQKTAQSPRLYDYMCKYHQSPSFRTLRHLEISDHPEFVTSAEDQAHQEDKIAEAISLLPSLNSLELETCDIVNARFLERLPKTLTRLRLANCEALDSDAMQVFFSQDGGCLLEELVLDHNVRLDLAFLPLLKSTCSRLRVLSMDLHYYSQHHTVNDADARYQYLLGANDIPTWPSTLQTIQLIHLQKWEAEGAQNLFSSLIDSAHELPNLRRLTLYAHISISWRDRASFRERWIDKLTKVFLRRCQDPDPSLASMKAFRMAKQLREAQAASPSSSRRRVVAVYIPVPPQSGPDFSDHDDEQLGPAGRRSKRIAESEKQRAEQSATVGQSTGTGTDDSGSGSSTDSLDDEDEPAFVQGMCNVVDVTIDNQRPREEQFNESHFLDSEGSGDEDWNEGDEMPDDEGYAW